jgi:hypothetical protein
LFPYQHQTLDPLEEKKIKGWIFCNNWRMCRVTYTTIEKSFVAVHNYHQLRFLNRYRCGNADNPGLPLLISIINNGSKTAAENQC